jgi:hypothetical protein
MVHAYRDKKVVGVFIIFDSTSQVEYYEYMFTELSTFIEKIKLHEYNYVNSLFPEELVL